MCVTGRARVALTRAKCVSYKQPKEALLERFEPPSKRELYKNELQLRVKRETESWGDFADEVGVLTEKAYPELQEEAREQLTLRRYFDQLQDPRVALGVRQRHPKTLSEAVTVTLELESYLLATPAQHHEGPQEHKITQPDLFAMLNTLMES